MNSGFKFKYDQIRENDPTKKESAIYLNTERNAATYYENSNAKNVCFVWPDGKRIFLNYSYLVSGEYQPEENSITLTWTTHVVNLKGYQLEKLFNELMHHLPKEVVCIDTRYIQTIVNGTSIVKDIFVLENT